jgi:hypothetical protein
MGHAVPMAAGPFEMYIQFTVVCIYEACGDKVVSACFNCKFCKNF